MSKISKAVILVSLSLGAAGLITGRGAHAAMMVIGGGAAHDCYIAAKTASGSSAADFESCTLAIETEPLSARDLAATYVNRGALYMNLRQWTLAQRDFDQALKIEPKLGDALVDRGAANVGLGDGHGGVDDITAGLALGSGEPAKAYYNRALAYEAIGDEKSAYFDFQKAAQLAPSWPAPRAELTRFTVVAPQ